MSSKRRFPFHKTQREAGSSAGLLRVRTWPQQYCVGVRQREIWIGICEDRRGMRMERRREEREREKERERGIDGEGKRECARKQKEEREKCNIKFIHT